MSDDAIGVSSPTRPAPTPAPGDAHPGDLRYADLDRLTRFLRRVRGWNRARPTQHGRLSRAHANLLADHERRIAGDT